MRVRLSEHVVAFVRSLPPEPRKRMRSAIRGLAQERGDIVPLEGALEGFCRLRVGTYRVVFVYASDKTIECVLAERRSIVHELLMNELGL